MRYHDIQQHHFSIECSVNNFMYACKSVAMVHLHEFYTDTTLLDGLARIEKNESPFQYSGEGEDSFSFTKFHMVEAQPGFSLNPGPSKTPQYFICAISNIHPWVQVPISFSWTRWPSIVCWIQRRPLDSGSWRVPCWVRCSLWGCQTTASDFLQWLDLVKKHSSQHQDLGGTGCMAGWHFGNSSKLNISSPGISSHLVSVGPKWRASHSRDKRYQKINKAWVRIGQPTNGSGMLLLTCRTAAWIGESFQCGDRWGQLGPQIGQGA